MTAGLVSIITTIYNSEQFIAGAIESVLAQTYSCWEMIVTDDGSTDNGCSVVEEYSKRDSRIRLLKLGYNGGPGIARNNSIRNAQGRFVAFLDSDDIWMPDKLERQLELMLQKKCGMVYSSYLTCNENSVVIGMVKCRSSIRYRREVCDNAIGFLTMMYDREQCGTLLLPELRKRQDWALDMAILKKCRVAYGYSEKPLAVFRKRKGSLSSGKLSLIRYNIGIYHKILGYSKLKSVFVFLFVFLPFYFGKKALNFLKTMFLPVRGKGIENLNNN